ncbi:MAG: adenosine kinase [Natronospirillum sp.]
MSGNSTPEFDVFAIGHAIVDEEYCVEDHFLSRLNIQRAERTLINFERRQQLLVALNAEGDRVYQAGGGSAANSIVTAQQLGARCHFACKVANDEAGRFFHADLAQSGIDLPSAPLAKGHTGRCLVMITPDAERTMNTYTGITDELDMPYVELDKLRRSRWLYLESYLITTPTANQTTLAALQVAHDANIPVVVNFADPGIVRFFKPQLSTLFERRPVDVLICNHEEALAWADTTDLEAAIAVLSELAHRLIITEGADGAHIITPQGRVTVPAPKVIPVNTTGAGDTFAGGILYGLAQDWTLERAAELACRCAARKVEMNGARLPAEEVALLHPR